MIFKFLFWIQEGVRIVLLRLKFKKCAWLPFGPLQKLYVKYCQRVDSIPSAKSVKHSLSSLKVFVVAQLPFGSTSRSRRQALELLVGEVRAFDILPLIDATTLSDQILINQLYAGPRVIEINRLIKQIAHEFQPQVLWVDRGLHVEPDTLRTIRRGGCQQLIHFSPDNHRVVGNQSHLYFQCLPLFDAHITTKTDNVQWLKQGGARRVEMMGKGFDPQIHRPLSLSAEDQKKFGCDIGFVGHWEPSREEILLHLQNRGYQVKVWGGGWDRAYHRTNPLFADCPHLVGDDYAKAMNGAKINLCLLSKWFQDLTTARSIEIPACGKFLLAERNVEHQALFKEGVEAEFYSSSEELLKKIDYYLQNHQKREAIAEAGRQRCLSGYSNQDRLKDVLERLRDLH
jgi:hypothetical protein